jgi:hypothetical protein
MPAAAVVVVVVLYIYIARRWAMMSGGGEGREPRILANKSRRFVGGSLARSPNPSAFARLNVFFFPGLALRRAVGLDDGRPRVVVVVEQRRNVTSQATRAAKQRSVGCQIRKERSRLIF